MFICVTTVQVSDTRDDDSSPAACLKNHLTNFSHIKWQYGLAITVLLNGKNTDYSLKLLFLPVILNLKKHFHVSIWQSFY